MRSPAEARESMDRAIADRNAHRLSYPEFEGIKERAMRKLIQFRKQALLSEAAKIRTRGPQGIQAPQLRRKIKI